MTTEDHKTTVTFTELMIQVKATDEEKLACAIRLAKHRAYKTINHLVCMREVSAEDLLKEYFL